MAAPKGNLIDLGSPDSFGKDFLRYIRLKYDWTQSSLDHRFKKGKGFFGRIERGELPITQSLAKELSKFFEEPMDKFYGSP